MFCFLFLLIAKANLLLSAINMTSYFASLTKPAWEREQPFTRIRDQQDYTSILLIAIMNQGDSSFDRSSTCAKAEILRFMSTETTVRFIDHYRDNEAWEWEGLMDCISFARPKDKVLDAYITRCMTDTNARNVAHLYWIAKKRHYYGLIPFAFRDFFSQRYVPVINAAPNEDYRLRRFARDYLIGIWTEE